MAACSNKAEDIDNAINDSDNREVSFTATISPDTRVEDDEFYTGDKISVTAFDDDALFASAITYTYNGYRFVSSNNAITLDSDEQALSYIAVYPVTSSRFESNFEFSVESDQSAANNLELSDLLISTTEATNSESPTLDFNHALSSLAITLEGEGLDGGTMTIYAQPTTAVDLDKKSYTATGDEAIAITAAADGSTYKVIFAPQTIETESVIASYELTSGRTYKWRAARNLTFESGYRYTYTWSIDIDIDTDEGYFGDITYTGEIEGWEHKGLDNTLDEALSDDAMALQSALFTLQSYMSGITSDATEVDDASTAITTYGAAFAENEYIIGLAFATIDLYEESYGGALFINSYSSAANSKMSRTSSGLEIHFAQAALQQALVDYAYTSESLSKFGDTFSANKFNTSDYFPGAVEQPADPESYTRTIEFNNGVSWGSPTTNETSDARRPTGCYAAPGSIVTVKVPQEVVDKGVSINVGSHTWDNSSKSTMKRLDRVTINYPITSTEVLVSNPLGGSIFIHVPYLMELGNLDIEITNAVRSPYYSNKLNVAEWETERGNPGAWTIWETDKMMIDMPTKWCYNLTHAEVEKSMTEWDLAMDAIIELRGWDPDQLDKTTLYLQCDLQMRGSSYYPGYPQTNDVYSPNTSESGSKDHYYINGPQDCYSACIHELGHAIQITKFRGETEAIVNYPYVGVMNAKFNGQNESDGHGYTNKWDLDTSYDLSFTYGSGINATLDGYATTWMVKDNFREGNEMNYSNVAGDEIKYQHRGWGKYVDYVNLFGWSSMNRFNELYEEDYMGAMSFFPDVVNEDPVDNRILQLSIAAGCDVRPLIHFWGIQPVSPISLASWISANNLGESDIIYDRLVYYKSVAPKNNTEFNTFQAQYCSSAKEDESTETNGDGWYWIWKTKYQEEHYDEICDQIDAILATYFTSGDPDPSTQWSNDSSSTTTSKRNAEAGDYTCTSSSPWKRAD